MPWFPFGPSAVGSRMASPGFSQKEAARGAILKKKPGIAGNTPQEEKKKKQA